MTQLKTPSGKILKVEPKSIIINLFHKPSCLRSFQSKFFKLDRQTERHSTVASCDHNYGATQLSYYVWGDQKLGGSAMTTSLYCPKNGDLSGLPVPRKVFSNLLHKLGITHQ